jgi:hypothetical protein
MADHQNEVVNRSAPRWAWDLIDETLALDAQSKAFDRETRSDIKAATHAMIVCCVEGDIESMSRERAGLLAAEGD